MLAVQEGGNSIDLTRTRLRKELHMELCKILYKKQKRYTRGDQICAPKLNKKDRENLNSSLPFSVDRRVGFSCGPRECLILGHSVFISKLLRMAEYWCTT